MNRNTLNSRIICSLIALTVAIGCVATPTSEPPTAVEQATATSDGQDAMPTETPVPPTGEASNEDNDGGILLITPYVSESDMAPVNVAFSSNEDCPWGYAHRGIDFLPNGNLKPFQAVCSGVVDKVELWQLDTTLNWQVSVRIVCNSTYSALYAFEPMSTVRADGETQLANISVSEGQVVAQGDLVGHLFTTNEGSHVDFGFHENWESICPEPYFTKEARESILNLFHITRPDTDMCH